MPPSENQDPDEEKLVARAQDGDTDAFSQLLEGLQPRLLAQATAFSKNPDLARDLVQETMIAAWNSLPSFDGSCQLFTWLYVILLRRHRRSIGWFSRRIPLATAAQLLAASRHEACVEGDQGSPGADESELLRSMVCALSPKHQEVVRLRFYAGASEAETASALGISPGTVKSRLHHGLQKLRRMKEKVNVLRDPAHQPIETDE